ncbi:cardioactive peptide-like [Macrobrachium nipponense]|uniref:Crustacean cardioactive peptide n=1 Tax=Macrobrachium nipponense TaxID=159736 RepID=A0A343EHG3_MACNP|nr:crustacean cardioactive peptide precursor [Macrobrachium nipponense]
MFNQSFSIRSGVLAAVLLLIVVAMQTTASPVAKRDIGGLLEGKDKRPFCNAFTGCGKKRSDASVEALASGTELDDLAKHVLAEAKLWEQLQNKMDVMRSLAARMDEQRPLYRRKRSPAAAPEPRQQLAASSQQQQPKAQ